MNVAFAYRAFESLGVEQLSACLKQHGHRTRLAFDPGLFADAFLRWDAASRWFRFREEMVTALSAPDVGLVCFSPVTYDVAWALDLARAVKARRPDRAVAMGGPHATVLPRMLLEEPAVDYAVAGEGEEPILRLVEALEHGSPPPRTPGLFRRADGGVTGEPPALPDGDLDALPFADRALFRRAFPGLVGIHMVTSRHCPNSCTYCHNNALRRVYGAHPHPRRHSPERVVEELEQAKTDFPTPSVRFFDELFTADPDWLEAFVEPYRKRIDAPFHCAVSPVTITPRTAELLARGGCYEVQLGVQTLREDVRRDLLRRPESGRQVGEALRLLRARGIRTGVDIILGLPGVTEADLEDTARFFSNHNATRINLYWLQPVPGTDMLDHLHRIGWLTDAQKRSVERGEEASGYFTGGLIHRTARSMLPYEWLIASAAHRSPRSVERTIRRRWFRRIPRWIPPHVLWLASSLRSRHAADTMALRTRNRYRTFIRRKLLRKGLTG